MADEVSYATLLANGGRVAKLLSSMIHDNLYDPSDLRSLMQFVPWTAGGSDTQNVTTLDRALVQTAASSETSSGFANTAISTGNYDLTVARYGAIMAPTDLMAFTGGALDVEVVTSILVGSMGQTMTDLLCALFPNVSTTAGSTGVDLSVDTWFDAKFALNLANNPAMTGAVLQNASVNQLRNSIRGETGAIERLEATQEQLERMGIGYQGRFAGVDVWQSDKVDKINANADYANCMFTMGAFAYTMGAIAPRQPLINPTDIIVATPDLFVERNRDAVNGLSQLVVNSYPAVAEQEDARAVQIISAV